MIVPGVPEIAEVWLDAGAREFIAEESAKRRLRETGGGLFGFEGQKGLVVVHALAPGPKARHRRTRLIPDYEYLQLAINEIHSRSNGRLSYIGEWHTHPLGRAHPSSTDESACARIASLPETDLARPLVIIQVTKPLQIQVQLGALAAFRWNPNMQRLVPLKIELTSIDDSSFL